MHHCLGKIMVSSLPLPSNFHKWLSLADPKDEPYGEGDSGKNGSSNLEGSCRDAELIICKAAHAKYFPPVSSDPISTLFYLP